MFLEQFTPFVLEVRDVWFPLATEIHTYCDPNGDSPSSHGMKVTAAEYLRSQGIAAAGAPTGNDPGGAGSCDSNGCRPYVPGPIPH
jgi:hypothetical protein